MENKIIIIERTGKHDPDYDSVKWAISVRSKDKMRPNIICVKMDDGLLVATNGNQIHLYTPTREIENGVYSVISETKSLITLQKADIDYPQYERVFPQATHNGIMPLEVTNNADYHATQVCNHVLKQTDAHYFIEQLIAACPMGESLIFEQGDGHPLKAPLVIHNKEYTKAACIMPIRMT